MPPLYDHWTRWRMGFPARGRMNFHPRGAFTFEQGAEFPQRLTSLFGDLASLVALDLGCGPGRSVIAQQVLAVPWARLISVDAFTPYTEELAGRPAAAGDHQILNIPIQSVFDVVPPRSADLVLMIDVIEHFSRREALDLLRRLESFVKRGIVLFAPMGCVEQEAYDANELQRHRSAWEAGDFTRLGYEVTIYEAFHGHLDPPATAAWAIKRFRD